VYVKQLELSNFKSFGGTTKIPMLPGFTVVSGPNGSGKSNLLDALLFALGLSTSKGMRAERLPDLVNHAQIKRGHAINETRVSVTFQLSEAELAELAANEADADTLDSTDATADLAMADDDPMDGDEEPAETLAPDEWKVTRKLRVTKQGTYTSSYAINDEPCTLSKLHEELNRRRIYPEGYNVVLQGDVTNIVSMNARQRREIIDELAGVASFDRKINQAREKLDAVKEQEERFRIVETELIEQRDRLDRDRIKAQKYKALRAELQSKKTWEGVLLWKDLQTQIEKLQQQLVANSASQEQLAIQITAANAEIETITAQLEELNAQVRALGEEEHLAIQSQIANQEAELRQLQRQQAELVTAQDATTEAIAHTQSQLKNHQQALASIEQQRQALASEEITALVQQRDQAQADLETIRSQSQETAESADAWMQQQGQLNEQRDTLLQSLEPQRAEQAQLRERVQQLERQTQLQDRAVQQIDQEITETQGDLKKSEAIVLEQEAQVQGLAAAVANSDQSISTQDETQKRLLREQQEKQRQLDKLEAQEQAQQEAQGTHATRIIRKAKLKGVHGLVAQLGQVDARYQVALEVAAGGRMGQLVVDDDEVAAAGIEILKRERGGRATFLPLNQIRRAKGLPPLKEAGVIDYALHLIDFDSKYEPIFAYVFGNTVVFPTLEEARRHIGRYRMVTLEGDLLEATGAMTGGSRSTQTTLHFGTGEAGESAAIVTLRRRLQEIEDLLNPLAQKLGQAQDTFAQASRDLIQGRQAHREAQLRAEQLAREVQTLQARRQHLADQGQAYRQEFSTAKERLQTLEVNLPEQETALEDTRQALVALEQSQAHGEWQVLQQAIQAREVALREREQMLRHAQQRLGEFDLEQQRLLERQQQGEQQLQVYAQQQVKQSQQQAENQTQQETLTAAIVTLQADLAKLEERLGSEKQERDRTEQKLKACHQSHQQLLWQLEKLQATAQEHNNQLQQTQEQLTTRAQELPEPLPELPEDLTLEQLQQQLHSLQKRLEAMEPVNMLAIEEYDRTQARLEELTEKLETLLEERTEVLLRIENFTTLRLKAFKESFDAVNANFQKIFAELSDGDGHLQLENQDDPFLGGLNMIAHPKGKPVQRLASMSGGERSLTALSFIFSLQSYRPSPFYAFDEVDMNLDGANVERLSKMIQQQAMKTQFMVISLRRPMIEAADRTIGVTQARGTHTQVIGLQLRTAAQG
jgi:chromosome segregation protein